MYANKHRSSAHVSGYNVIYVIYWVKDLDVHALAKVDIEWFVSALRIPHGNFLPQYSVAELCWGIWLNFHVLAVVDIGGFV